VRGSRRTRLTLVLLLLTAFTLTALDYNSAQSGPLAALRRGIDTVFGPVQRAVGGAATNVGNALGGLPRLGSYQSDNRKLKQENDRLKGVIASQAGLQCRYDQIQALQGFTDFTGYPLVPAHVVSVGTSSDFEWTATLDVGSLDGVRANMTVVTGYGLVGRTLSVTRSTAVVLLINDPEMQVGGTLVGLDTFGIAAGKGAGSMEFTFSGKLNQSVRKGTVVLTLGTDTYAPGVPIGTVTDTKRDTNLQTRTGTLVPFVDVTHLGEVGVIVQKQRTTPRRPFLPHAPGPTPTSSPCPAAVPAGPVPTAPPAPTATPSRTPVVSPSATPSRTP
jgi:rod shape-determining protein MreC